MLSWFRKKKTDKEAQAAAAGEVRPEDGRSAEPAPGDELEPVILEIAEIGEGAAFAEEVPGAQSEEPVPPAEALSEAAAGAPPEPEVGDFEIEAPPEPEVGDPAALAEAGPELPEAGEGPAAEAGPDPEENDGESLPDVAVNYGEPEELPDVAVSESGPEEMPDMAVADFTPAGEAGGEDPEAESRRRGGLFSRFREKLSATRAQLAGRLESLLSTVRTIDENLLDELEELLITSDLGAQTTSDLLFKIRGQVDRKELNDAEALKTALKKRMFEMVNLPAPVYPQVTPLVLFVVGINGVGKTTTIAKLTWRLQREGKKVLLAAGDTFRSAAVEQLAVWAERLGADLISQPTGSDASAVVFDALNAAVARGSDVVIIDTAGRLHTKVNLMDELKKIKRVADKALPGAPHHTILVLDGNTGQNAQRQAQTFKESIGVDSIIITKLDGTAKGGVIVSIANELKVPIAYVGLGETFEDLQAFDPRAFTEAILSAA